MPLLEEAFRDGKFVAPFNLKRTPAEAAADLKRYL